MADIRQKTAILDNFNRTENPLSNGGLWSQMDTARSPLKADGVSAVLSAGPGSNYSYWNPTALDGDDAECWAYAVGGNSPAQAWRLGLMKDLGGSGAADGYLFSMEITTGGGSTRLQRVTNMAFTDIDTNTDNPPTGGDWIGLIRRNGNDVEGWASSDGGANWALYVSATDTTYTTGLYPTLGIAGTLVGWDYFGAGPVDDTFIPQIYRRIYTTPQRLAS